MVADGVARLLDVRIGDGPTTCRCARRWFSTRIPSPVFRGCLQPDRYSHRDGRTPTVKRGFGTQSDGGPPLVVLAAGSQVSDAAYNSDGTRVLTTSSPGPNFHCGSSIRAGRPASGDDGSPTAVPWFKADWVAGDSQVVTGGTKGTTYFDANTGERLASYVGGVDEASRSARSTMAL